MTDRVLSKLEIYQAAKAAIDAHGDDAALWVAGRADALLEEGNLHGQRTMLRVLEAVKELQRTDRQNDPLN